jgi:integrase
VHDRFLIPRIKEYFKKKTLKEITVGDVEKFKMYIQRLKTERGKERSSASVNKHLVLLSSILTRAVENEILLSNPARSVSKLPEHNERIANLTYESEKTLFDVIKVSEYHGYMKEIVLVAIGTGMRKSEILKLTWDRVDFEQRQIHLLSKSTKNRKERFIPISEPVLQCLK